MRALENLVPKKVFYFFEEISKIPHGSFNTKEISDFLVEFAKERNLEHYQDELGNVIVIKEATKGYEDSTPVIIQGHMDMVCDVAPTSNKDMSKEGLELFVDGDFVKAKDTTLGGDDGIALAMALAILDDNNLEHPRVECVFTVDEEVGLIGAEAIDLSMLKGKMMINIDSEEEGTFFVSAAGGIAIKTTFDVSYEDYAGEYYTVNITGLCGGHSGIDIVKNGKNANKILSSVLKKLKDKVDFRLVAMFGGPALNIITQSSKCLIKIADDVNAKNVLAEIEDDIKASLKELDNNFNIEFEKCGDFNFERPFYKDMVNVSNWPTLDNESTNKILDYIIGLPQGVIAMSKDIEGLVQTSANIGVVTCEESKYIIGCNTRSSVEKEKNEIANKIFELAKSLEGNYKIIESYSAWEYNENSKLIEVLSNVYKDMYNDNPIVTAIHAGLECGHFCNKIKGLDVVSIGPTMSGVHTCNEKLSISSTKRVYEMVVETLSRLK